MSHVTERPDSLAGKRVLITGGSSGIGLACAHELAARGARVALLARGDEALQEAATSLGAAHVVTADVSDPDAMQRALSDVVQALGAVDAVIANAAAAVYGPFADMSPDDYRRTIDITLLGMINTAHAALPHLEPTSGTLVVVGSISGRVPTPWLSVYTAAKHGVRGFVRTLQIELRALGSPVTVALVAPGPVDTPFWRRARTTDGRVMPRVLGAYRPEDVASEVARALDSPRTERTVGGMMASWALVDAIAPNTALRVVSSVAKIGWRKRENRPVNRYDSLAAPLARARQRIGFRTRPSVLVKLRDLGHAGLAAWQTRSRNGGRSKSVVDPGADRYGRGGQRSREDRRSRAALDALHARLFNYDAAHPDRLTVAAGWRHETRCQALPGEDPGPPVRGGSWEIARDLMRNYEFADPAMVRAVYHADAPLEGRDMLLVISFLFLRFRVGVRVGGVFDESRTLDGREVRVYGWNYRTLGGHFEMGQMNYELWKWIDNGDVEFRVHGVWRPGGTRNPFLIIGFRLFGPYQRERFYAAACRRMVALTTARLERRPEDPVPRAAETIAIKAMSRTPTRSGSAE
jgi:NAD(P)-dependent dehydrogenase (short-subunit alcohol dehydrogenase family)